MQEKKSHTLLNIFIIVVISIILLVLYSKYLGTKGLVVKEYRVESNILTTTFSGTKIVHFSDLLYKSTVDKDDVQDLVERINILKPDIVVFTGNLVTNGAKITDEDTEFLTFELSKINVSIDKYAIYGEYDYKYSNYEFVMIHMKKYIQIIMNQYI